MPNPQPGEMEQRMDVDRAWIERLKVDPANVAAQLVALTNVSDWARGMHRENFDGYLIAAAELLTRPTPDGEIGELVMLLHKMAKCIYIAVEETVADDIADGLNKAATALETQAADIARLREALEAAVFALRNNGYPETAAELERAATRTDVR